MTSGIDLALVALLAGLGLPGLSAAATPVRLGAALSAVFLMTEALLGAALVLLEHVARNQSSARAYSLSAHLINTLTLLACLTLTAWWAMGKRPCGWRGRPAWMAACSLGMVMILGVSGAIAALGDTLFPSRSLAEGLAHDFDPAASIFVRLRVLHPVIAALAGAWLVFYAVTTAGRRPRPAPARLAAARAGRPHRSPPEWPTCCSARRCGCRWSTCCWPTRCGSRWCFSAREH